MFQYEEFEGETSLKIEAKTADHAVDGNSDLTIREKIKAIMHSKSIHIMVFVLIMLDCVFVVLEMLIDLGYIPLDEPNVFPDVLHGFSIAVLSAFMVEISLKIYVDPKHFFSHKIEMLDGIVVLVSWVVDIVLAAVEDTEILALLGLLVLLRLVRITNGIVVTAKARADERVRVVKNKNRTLEERLQEAQNKIEYQDAKIINLERYLQEHGLEYHEQTADFVSTCA